MRVLSFTDLGYTVTAPALGTNLRKFKRVEINLLVMCTPDGSLHNWWDGAKEISTHTSWMDRVLAGIPSLEELVIRMYIHWKASGERKWPPCLPAPSIHEELEKLIGNTPRLRRLEIYPFFWRNEYEDPWNRVEIYTKHEVLAGLWTKEGGWVDL